MTPPLPLAELVKQLPVAIEDMEQSVAAWRGIVEVPALTAAQMATIRVLSSALHYLALPLGRCETCKREANAAEAQITRLTEALREHGAHAEYCLGNYGVGSVCSCGLRAALAPATPPEGPTHE